ncbi:MAG TPA: PAS domain S-box protein [Spirochaetota bacterium]|nr:PAS domain S-box protein [Spirochaetota bacterium]
MPAKPPDDRDDKLRSIFLAAPVGIGMVSNRIILEANDTLCRMTGYSKGEMIGRDSSFLYPTMEDYNFVGKEKYARIRRTGIGTIETRWKKKDGTIIDILLSSVPLDIEDLSRGVTFTALDITERKKSEKVLLESEKKLKTYIDHSPDAIFIADSNGILQELNSRVEDITGYSIDELTGRHIRAIHIEEEIPDGLREFEKVLKNGKAKFEFRLRRKTGGNVPVLLEAGLLPDGRVIGYCRDISERKMYEEKIQEYLAKIKRIADNIPGILYQYNANSREHAFKYINQKADEVFGIDINRPDYLDEFIKHVHPDYRDKFVSSTKEAITKKTGWFFEWPFVHHSGEIKWYRGVSNPDIKDDELIFYGVIQDITDEKKMQIALISSEAKHRSFVELAVDGIILATNDGIISEANSSSENILSKKRNEIIGKHISSLFTAETLEKTPLRLDLLREGETVIRERDVHRDDGSVITVEIHSKMMPDGTMQAIFQDVTQRKKNAEALAASEERYRNLVELAVDGIILGTEKGIITEINSSTEAMLLKSRDEIIGKHISSLFTEETLESSPLRTDLLRKGETVIRERDIHRSNGTYAAVEMHTKMMPDGSFQTILRDITERKRDEEALASEKERLAVTLRSIGDGVIAADTEGKILLMNSVAENLTGWKFDECRGKTLRDIFVIKDEFTGADGPDIIESVLKTGDIVELASDMLLVSRDGLEIIISDSGAPIRDSNGSITGVVIVFRDITEKRRLAESLQRSQKLDALATLAGGIAHDFNNMLGGILGYIDLARNYSKTGDDVAAYLDKAMIVFDRAKNLTGQLMTFARGGDPLMRTDIIASVLKEYSVSALKDYGKECAFAIPEDLWITAFDRIQIGQVIYNIVTNAREFMGAEGEIKISAVNTEISGGNREHLKPGKYVRVEIEDSGQGIPGNVFPHIFDPFFTTKKKGNGLGLSTSYSIIRRHGGTLNVESSEGTGTLVRFYLPAVIQEKEPDTEPGEASHRGSGTILIMDDEYFIVEIISQMLEHMGYRTARASNGVDMLNLFNDYKDNPELKCIILDLTIPGGMGGKETVAEIRKINSKIPVFASSGYSSDRIISNPEPYGFTDSIRKPFTANELSMLLNRHIR